jgi:hypothetical protein
MGQVLCGAERECPMTSKQTGILTFRTASYEEAKGIVQRLAEAGFPTAAIGIGSTGQAH